MADENTKLFIPALGGIYKSLDGFAMLVLRVVVGFNLIPHGMQKLFGSFGGKVEGTAGFLTKMGLEPALPLAYYIGLLEFFGGILLVIGLWTRFVSAQLLAFMLVAAFWVHMGIGGFFWNKGGMEYPLLWAAVAFFFMIRGAGPMSIDRKIGKEF